MWRCALLVAVVSFAGWSYEWDIVLPEDPGFSDIWRLDSLNAVTVSGRFVWRTTDGGITWDCDTLAINSFPNQLRDVCFGDALRGFCRGWNGPVWKTENGGTDWSATTLTVANANDMAFANRDTGLIVCDSGTIHRTLDGGETWQTIQHGDAGYDDCQAVSPTLWFIGGDSTLATSTDAGSTWTSLSIPALPAWPFITMIHFLDEQTGWFIPRLHGRVYRTFDGGVSWDSVTVGLRPKNLFRLAPDTVFAFGTASPFIQRAVDTGGSWQSFDIGPEANLDGVAMLDSRRGWATDMENRRLFETSDGWATAQRLDRRTGGKVNTVDFVDTRIGMAGGQYGLLKRTTDGGRSWEGLVAPTYQRVISICLLSPSRALLSCDNSTEAGRMFVSEDTGRTWVRIEDPVLGEKFLQYMVCADSMRIAGVYGSEVVSSEDGGRTWQTAASPAGNTPNAITFNPSGALFIACWNGRIFSSPDFGRNWDQKTTSTTRTLYGICFGDSMTGYACGSSGAFLTTIDGGEQWDHTYLGGDHFEDMVFSSPLHGFLLVDGKAILRTVDGGINWSVDSLGNRIDLLRTGMTGMQIDNFCALDDNHAWMGAGEAVMVFERVLTLTATPETVAPGAAVSLDIETGNVYGVELHRWDSESSWVRVDSVEAEPVIAFTWPGSTAVGHYLFRVREGYDSTNAVVCTVTVNNLPVWSDGLPDTLVAPATEETRLSLTGLANDIDGHGVAYMVEGASWCTVRGDTLVCAPDTSDTTVSLTVLAVDSLDGRAGDTMVVFVERAVGFRTTGGALSYAPPRVLPPAAQGVLAVGYSLLTPGRITVRLYAPNGRTLARDRFIAPAGPGTRRIEGVAGLPPGAYVVDVNDGVTVVRTRVVVAR